MKAMRITESWQHQDLIDLLQHRVTSQRAAQRGMAGRYNELRTPKPTRLSMPPSADLFLQALPLSARSCTEAVSCKTFGEDDAEDVSDISPQRPSSDVLPRLRS